ncbi:MAG: ribulose-phosphate 3-epimerase [Planctomycetes bacterium]|nr:ribulose-phosphate 3-epimerase [Planctomycetota bacterium]
MGIKIAPCVLDADLTRLRESIAEVEEAGADVLHVDAADGHFAANLMAGLSLTRAIAECATVPVGVHLMITDPLRYAPAYVDAGAQVVIFHAETVDDLPDAVNQIKTSGVRVGVALNPDTPPQVLAPVVGRLDCVVVMTVEPGFSGQGFIEKPCRKIPVLRRTFGSGIDIYVDGGVGPETAPIVVGYGANVLAAASAIFRADQPPGKALRRLRRAAERGIMKSSDT